MKRSYPVAVIGAGPAGMAAATTLASHGVDVAVFDDQPHPGGQIFRQVDRSPLERRELLGKDYLLGLPQVVAFRAARIDYYSSASVWYLGRGGEIGVVHDGASHRLDASRVVVAAGAQERPMPFPGWQLPGVMTAGAGQILLKSAAMVPSQPPVLAGSGPLLLALAWQYLRAGVGVRALLDTTPAANRWRALRHLPRALAASDYLFKGLGFTAALRRARVPWYSGVSGLRAEGGDRLDRVVFRHRRGEQALDCALLLIHQGVIPALQLLEAADCRIEWSEPQQCWQAQTDAWGETSRPGIFAAGDGVAIGGARAAALGGRLAGLQLAQQLGAIDASARDRLAQGPRAARARHLAIRPLLDAYYRVAESALLPADDTLVCRCEEVSARELRQLGKLGCAGPNQAKAFTRCGMGPCQGRFCGPTLERFFMDPQNPGEPPRLRARPPLKPVTLGQLAEAWENEHEQA